MMTTWTKFANGEKVIYLTQDSKIVKWKPYISSKKYYYVIDAPLTKKSGEQKLPKKFHRRMNLWYSELAKGEQNVDGKAST